MDKEAFRKLLQERQLSDEAIEQQIEIAERFEALVGADRPATAEDVHAFSIQLMAEGLNTFDNYVAVARYGRLVKNDEVYIAVFELIDGSEAMENLSAKLAQWVGEEKRDQVFMDIELPPLGTLPADKPQITQRVIERMEAVTDPETCQKLLSGSLRHLDDAWYAAEKEKYQACGNVDAYLQQSGDDFLAQLETHQREGTLFFTQEVTDGVIDFVRDNREISHGVRDGNIVYETKIPYMTKQYLEETDPQLKGYYYCHCPWVRESLKMSDVQVSATFCHCSAGFHKKRWDVIFGQELEAEAVASILQGDPWCRFAIHLPEHATLTGESANRQTESKL